MSNSDTEDIDAAIALENAVGVRFSREVQQIVRGSFSEAENVSDFPRGITTPRLLLGLLYCGKNFPSESREIEQFARLVGHDAIGRLALRYRQNGQFEDNEARLLPNRKTPYSPESLELLERAGKLAPPNSPGIEPHHVLLAMTKAPSPCCLWLMKDFPQIWEDVAVTVFGYPQASALPDEPDFDRDARILRTNPARSKVLQNWENHLERRYNASFAADGVELIAAAAAQSQKIPDRRPMPSGILNTRDFLPTMFLDSQLLSSLILQGSITSTFGGITPPWVEEMCDRDSNPDSQLAPGNLPFSRHVEEALKSAARLAASTPDYPSINKWHIAWAIISSHAPGITTSLLEGGTDTDQAIGVLLANMERDDPRLFRSATQVIKESSSRGDNASKRTGHGTFGAKEFNRLPTPDRDAYSTVTPPLSETNLPSDPEVSADTNDSNNSIEPMGGFGPTSDWIPFNHWMDRFTRNERMIAYVHWLVEQCLNHGYTRSLTIEALYASLLSWEDGGPVLERFGENVSQFDQEELRRQFLSACTAVSSPENYRGTLFVSDPVKEVFEAAKRNAMAQSDGRIDPIDLMVVLLAPPKDLEIRPWWTSDFSGRENSFLRREFSAALRLHPWDAEKSYWLNLIESTAFDEPLSAGSMFQSKREAHDEELCLNVEAYAGAVAQLLRDAAEEDDFVLAIYGPWGRGKTTLMGRVKAILGSPKSVDGNSDPHEYVFVDFSAWKYPTRPEVWIHLYEQITLRATRWLQTPGKGEKVKKSTDQVEKTARPEVVSPQESFWQRSGLAFRIGLLRSGWPPLLLGLVLLLVTRLPLDQALEWLRVGLGTIGLLLLVLFSFSAISLGHRVRMRYLSLPDHSEGLGMQAVIGRDLANLLKVWIDPSKKKDAAKSISSGVLNRIDFRWGQKGSWGSITTVILIIATFAVVAIRIPRPSQRSALVSPTDLLRVSAQVATITSESGSFQETPSAPSISTKVAPPINPVDVYHTPTSTVVARSPSTVAYCTSQTILAIIALTLVIFVIGLSLPLQQHRKLLLIIDDLDRCEPDQMLAVIESLRLFLDNPEMSRRLQVVMLVDQRFLGSALLKRAAVNGLTLHHGNDSQVRYVREQREKFFVAELGLPRISPENLSEMVDRHLKESHVEDGTQGTERTSKGNLPALAAPPSSNPLGETDAREANPDGAFEPNADDSHESGALIMPAEVEITDVRTLESEPIAVPESAEQPEDSSLKRLKFTKGERALLQSAIAQLHSREPTPRQVRASVVRYQLARLLLQHLGEPVTEASIPEILDAIRSQMHEATKSEGISLIDQVAHSVVCPDIAYSGNDATASSD